MWDSRLCRIKLIWKGWEHLEGNSISIHYGRLHAPNEKQKLIWNGERCHAWHNIKDFLHFLDGRSPSQAASLDLSHFIIDKYYEEAYRQQYRRRQPEWLMTMHMEAWEHYGKRFFELFDLQRPDLWEQYSKFLKEVYDIKGRSSFIDPPMDKVC